MYDKLMNELDGLLDKWEEYNSKNLSEEEKKERQATEERIKEINILINTEFF